MLRKVKNLFAQLRFRLNWMIIMNDIKSQMMQLQRAFRRIKELDSIEAEFKRITDPNALMEGCTTTVRMTNAATRTYALYAQKKIAQMELDSAENKASAHELLTAAQAVVERWHTPLWKDVSHTADFINRLSRACSEFEENSRATL